MVSTPLGESDDDDDDVWPQPSQLWYGMITPLLPMRFAGVLWYQGEANAGDPSSYACRFPAMITDWRKRLGIPDLPFLYVQLAAYDGSDLSWIRAAQDAALDLERVRRVLAIDLGDPTSPFGSIHSRRKQQVGRRLALDLLYEVYGTGSGAGGPELVDIVIKDDSDVTQLRLQLKDAPDLALQGTAACSECCYELPFETLAARTGNWTRVTQRAVLLNNAIELKTESNVVGVRYDWEGYPQCAVYDTTRPRLPMAPFTWCRYGGGIPPWADGSCDVASGAVLLRGANVHLELPSTE